MLFLALVPMLIPSIDWIPGTNIQRTMRLLTTSTPAKPHRVKILFYGQSITRQEWWRAVEADLRTRFPSAHLEVENRAIGGFAADRLKRTVLHDVVPSYPDLIILQDYGGEPDYEELVRSIRSHVASEILVQSDHVVWSGKPGEEKPGSEVWHDAHEDWLKNLAIKYRMGFVDVRSSWRDFLTKNRLPAASLLRDGVHLNDQGCQLMASLIGPALVYKPQLLEDPSLVRTLPAKREIQFEGNRVDVLAGSNDLAVEIDDKKPSGHSELIGFDRPSNGFSIDVPALGHVEATKPLQEEEWTLTLFDIARDVAHWKFRLRGSQTGDDGEGSSDAPFVSRSGRVAFEPRDWYVHEAFRITGQHPPEGFEVHFVARFRGADVALANARTTIANGLSSGKHTLVLRGNLAGARVVVYRPPLEE